MNNNRLALVGLMASLTLWLAVCGGQPDPEHLTFALKITGGKTDVSQRELAVAQGDTVTLVIASDQKGRFHLHGYDHERPVGPEQAAELTFEASATGRFNYTFHPEESAGDAGHGHGHGHEEEKEETLGALEVHPR